MRRSGSVGLWNGIVTGILAASGCAPVACAGDDQGPPTLELDAAPWFAAHPEAIGRVCLVTWCADLNAAQTLASIQVVHPSGVDRYDLVVRSGDTVVARETVKLVDGTVDGPCGRLTVMTVTRLVLQSVGRLTSAIRPTGA
ncbi:MAG: hypothetical protein JST33_03260 [Actinobacteria bacterium]|nr:hypothetical protein [Actinomycetota bacterium]